MSDCDAFLDRMPEVAHGLERWSDAEARHLLGCAECAALWLVIQQGERIGDHQIASLDDLALQLRERLRADLGVRKLHRRALPGRLWTMAGAVAVAASLFLVVGIHRSTVHTAATVAAETDPALFPELGKLSSGELQEVLSSMDTGNDAELSGPLPSLGSLDETQLQAMLQQLEEGS